MAAGSRARVVEGITISALQPPPIARTTSKVTMDLSVTTMHTMQSEVNGCMLFRCQLSNGSGIVKLGT